MIQSKKLQEEIFLEETLKNLNIFLEKESWAEIYLIKNLNESYKSFRIFLWKFFSYKNILQERG
jgi:hypothetical protein